MGSKQRTRTPPHTDLRTIRLRFTGMTLDEAGAAVADVLGLDEPLNRGTIGAIETGIRGTSQQMLDALAVAYGMKPGDFSTDYAPQATRRLKAASGE
jgi:hypothetical protein